MFAGAMISVTVLHSMEARQLVVAEVSVICTILSPQNPILRVDKVGVDMGIDTSAWVARHVQPVAEREIWSPIFAQIHLKQVHDKSPQVQTVGLTIDACF